MCRVIVHHFKYFHTNVFKISSSLFRKILIKKISEGFKKLRRTLILLNNTLIFLSLEGLHWRKIRFFIKRRFFLVYFKIYYRPGAIKREREENKNAMCTLDDDCEQTLFFKAWQKRTLSSSMCRFYFKSFTWKVIRIK